MVYLLVSIAIAAMTAAHLFVKKGMLTVGQFPQNFGELAPFFFESLYQYLCYFWRFLGNPNRASMDFSHIKSAIESYLSFYGSILRVGCPLFSAHL